MEKAETYKLVYTMREAYMATYMNLNAEAFRGMVDVWHSVLKDYSYEDCCRGLRLFLARDSKGFPPSPGQVIDMIHQLNPTRPEMSAAEAWSYVRKAIQDSGYHSVERYAALPPICKEIITSPESLEVMGQMSSDDVENVQKSHFIRAYNTLIERKKEDDKMPAEYKKLLEDKLEQLRQHQTTEMRRIEETNQVNIYSAETATSGLSKRVEEMLKEARRKIAAGQV